MDIGEKRKFHRQEKYSNMHWVFNFREKNIIFLIYLNSSLLSFLGDGFSNKKIDLEDEECERDFRKKKQKKKKNKKNHIYSIFGGLRIKSNLLSLFVCHQL